MKTTMKSLLSLLLTAALLVSMAIISLPVAAEEYGDLTATNIMGPINPNASQESKNLLAYLSSLKDTNTFVSGAFEMGTDLGIYHALENQFGVQVGLSSCRYEEEVRSNYSPEDGTYDVVNILNEEKASAMLLEQYQKGHILLIHFDGALLTWMQNRMVEKYGSEDDGIVHLDATNPDRDMEFYNAAMTYYEKLVGVLKRLEDSGVKAYLYRAFVEFSNHRFNGTGSYGKEVLTRVMQQYAELMKTSGLTGFLLTTSPNGGYYTEDCYVGNAYCDLLGVTIYSGETFRGELSPSVQFFDYEWYKRTGKAFGFTELSCRTGSYTKQQAQGRCSWYKTLTSMLQYWPEVAFVNTWGGGTYSLINHNSAGSETGGNDDGAWFLHSPYTLNLEDLPDYQNTIIKMPGVVKLYDSANYGGNNTGKTVNYDFVPLEERLYTTAELKDLGINPADILSFHISTGYSLTVYSGDGGSGDSWNFLNSSAYVGNLPSAGKIRSVRVSRPTNILLDYPDIYGSDNDWNAWKANDGLSSVWTAAADDKDEGWLYVDMGVPYIVNRWVVKHGGYVGLLPMYNTRDFCLQISDDGEKWVTVDTVAGNVDSYTNRTLKQAVQAQYFRLFITTPNNGAMGLDANQITIGEFELYGVEGVEEEPTPTMTTKKTTTTTKKVTTTTKKTTKKTTTTALKLATPKVTVSNATKGVKVSWGKVSKASSYRVYRRLYSSGKWGSWSKIKTTTSLTYTDESAKAGKNYQYMVKAVKGSVTSGYKAVSITRLSVPKVTVSNASKGVKVSWGKVTGASKYTVYRKTGSGSWSKIKTTTSTSYTDTKASAGKSYQYMVKAVKGDYTSYYKAASIRRLKAPSSVKLAKATKGFKVSWSKVTGATKYEVYRKTGNGSYTKIATTTKTAYTDKTAKKGKYYTYRVRAVYSSYKSVFKTGSKTKR